MGRALVIAAAVLLWPALARADTTEMKIEATGVTIYGEGYWELVETSGGWEYWKNGSDDVRKLGQLVFSPPGDGPCAPYGGAEDMTDEYAFEEDTFVWEAENNGGTVTAVCTQIDGHNYIVEATTWGGNLLMSFFMDINGMVHSYISRIRAAHEIVEPEHVEPIVVPDTTLLEIEALGRTLPLNGRWSRLEANVWFHSSGTTVTFESATTSCDARGAALPRDLFEEYPDAELSRLDDLGATDEVARVGVCLFVEDAAYWMTIEMPASLDPRSEPELGAMIHAFVENLVPGTVYQRPKRKGGWVWPHMFTGALVRRSDDLTSAWGVGIAVSRRPWHVERHLALGYEVDLTAASGWFSGAATLRPGLWAGTDANSRAEYQKGMIGEVYLALGADGTTGADAPDTGVWPTFGGGFALSLVTRATDDLGVGLDFNLQLLADQDGFHSDTEEVAFLSGKYTRKLMRFGFRHVGDPTTGSVWWFTLGVLDARNDR